MKREDLTECEIFEGKGRKDEGLNPKSSTGGHIPLQNNLKLL